MTVIVSIVAKNTKKAIQAYMWVLIPMDAKTIKLTRETTVHVVSMCIAGLKSIYV
jgi:hypothetical protein